MVASAESVGSEPECKPEMPSVLIRMDWEIAMGMACRLHAAAKVLRSHPDEETRRHAEAVTLLSQGITDACAALLADKVTDPENPAVEAVLHIGPA